MNDDPWAAFLPKEEPPPGIPPNAFRFTSTDAQATMRELALQAFETDQDTCEVGVVSEGTGTMGMPEWGDDHVLPATHVAMAFCLGRAARIHADRKRPPRILHIRVTVTAED